jgi:sialic acid synthase SpsE
MDISAGDSIERNMVTLKRPGTGIPARRLEDVVGRIARAPIPRDTILSWDMLR